MAMTIRIKTDALEASNQSSLETRLKLTQKYLGWAAVDWTPVPFIYPPVTPVTEALDQIPPCPYRPYKPGPYQ